MAKELDALLDSIERPGGFYYASVAAHEPSVATLEEGIQLLSDRCQTWTVSFFKNFLILSPFFFLFILTLV